MISIKRQWAQVPNWVVGFHYEEFGGGGIGMGTHVNSWLIHVNVCQKTLQYYKVISLQLIKIN